MACSLNEYNHFGDHVKELISKLDGEPKVKFDTQFLSLNSEREDYSK